MRRMIALLGGLLLSASAIAASVLEVSLRSPALPAKDIRIELGTCVQGPLNSFEFGQKFDERVVPATTHTAFIAVSREDLTCIKAFWRDAAGKVLFESLVSVSIPGSQS